MRRTLFILMVLILARAAPVLAQEASVQQVILHPAAEPDPALRHQFWPAAETRIQGNAAPFVSRAVILLLERAPSSDQRQAYVDKYERWRKMPINELPVAEVKDHLNLYASAALAELERAEPLMQIDYDLRLTELSIAEMVGTLLPEFQTMRELARMVQLRARVAVAEKRWDDFARDMRIGFRLSEVAGFSSDLLISRLVGYAISSVMMSVVQDAIQDPECPNLYWALATLPDSLFEIRKAIEFESILTAKLTSGFSELPPTPIGPIRARELIRMLADEATSLFGDAPYDLVKRDLLVGLAVVSLAEPSRDLLEQTAVWSGRTDELSAPEAVLRATVLKLQRSRHQWLKWAMLPEDRWHQYADRAETALKTDSADPDVFTTLAIQLIPAVTAAMRAAQRSTQQRNLLITMESLRMHASQTNQLPASIEELEPVPAWSDPLVNAAFLYKRQSPTSATLQGAPRHPGDKQSFQISLNTPSTRTNTEKSQ